MSQKMLHATYARQATSRIGAALDSVGSCFPGSRRRDPAAGVPRSGAQPAPCRRSCRRTVTGGRGGRKPVPDPVPRSVARSSPGSPRGPCAPPRKRKRYRLRWERGSALPDGTSNGAHWENLSASGTAKARFRAPCLPCRDSPTRQPGTGNENAGRGNLHAPAASSARSVRPALRLRIGDPDGRTVLDRHRAVVPRGRGQARMSEPDAQLVVVNRTGTEHPVGGGALQPRVDPLQGLGIQH